MEHRSVSNFATQGVQWAQVVPCWLHPPLTRPGPDPTPLQCCANGAQIYKTPFHGGPWGWGNTWLHSAGKRDGPSSTCVTRMRAVLQQGHKCTSILATQQKTSRPDQFEITPPTRDAVNDWIKEAKLGQDDYLFPSRIHESPHIGTRQYATIVDSWVTEIRLNPSEHGTHPKRRTKASFIYRRTKSLRAVQLLLGHTKLKGTVRYLGIEVDGALEMAEQTEV